MDITRLLRTAAATVALASALAGCALITGGPRPEASPELSTAAPSTPESSDAEPSSTAESSTDADTGTSAREDVTSEESASAGSESSVGPEMNAGAPTPPAGLEPAPKPRRSQFPQIEDPGIEGAVATALYSFHAEHYALGSGDVSLIEDVSDPGCVGCQSSIDGVRQLTVTQRAFVSGPPPEIKDLEIVSGLNNGSLTVRFTLVRPAFTVWNEKGATKDFPASETPTQMILEHSGGQWKVREVGALP